MLKTLLDSALLLPNTAPAAKASKGTIGNARKPNMAPHETLGLSPW
jgi:hypothetical protein